MWMGSVLSMYSYADDQSAHEWFRSRRIDSKNMKQIIRADCWTTVHTLLQKFYSTGSSTTPGGITVDVSLSFDFTSVLDFKSASASTYPSSTSSKFSKTERAMPGAHSPTPPISSTPTFSPTSASRTFSSTATTKHRPSHVRRKDRIRVQSQGSNSEARSLPT